MTLTTTLTCPLCGNEWTFSHQYYEKPIVGRCNRCMTDYNTATFPRNGIEWKRPKTLFYPRPVPEREQKAFRDGSP